MAQCIARADERHRERRERDMERSENFGEARDDSAQQKTDESDGRAEHD